MAERLEQAVATLNELVALADGCGLHESAQFLAMAKLHLLIDLNGITDSEFRALCAALDGNTRKTRVSRPARAPLGRNRRDGELRAMRRAWQCPQDAPPRRGGGRRAGQ